MVEPDIQFLQSDAFGLFSLHAALGLTGISSASVEYSFWKRGVESSNLSCLTNSGLVPRMVIGRSAKPSMWVRFPSSPPIQG
jgi:hypothetical protein